MDRLVLVRHAMPDLEPEVPAERWRLGCGGRAAARSLGPLMPGPAYYAASDEPKAVQTAQEIAGRLDVAIDPRFAEVRRRHVWSDEYRTLARAYVEGVRHDGWEPHAQVIDRFAAGVGHHAALAAARGCALVIYTHGMALTVWLASRIPLDPSPARFWEALRFPDVVDVDLTAKTARRLTRP